LKGKVSSVTKPKPKAPAPKKPLTLELDGDKKEDPISHELEDEK
jgi:hypothetical protein